MAELSIIDEWEKFGPLYRRRCLGDLIMFDVSHIRSRGT